MTTVYLVWRGAYSDARVEAVYDNRPDAETLATAMGDGYSGGYVEEMELNALPTRVFSKWEVIVERETGEILRTRVLDHRQTWRPAYVFHTPELSPTSLWDKEEKNWAIWGGVVVYGVRVSAETQEQAIKIATDTLAQHKAEAVGL